VPFEKDVFVIEQFAREELELFKFPRLYVDHVSSKLSVSVDAPELFDKKQEEEFEKTTAATREIPFWGEILEYNARLGASRVSLERIEALSKGNAVPVVTGQQPGLLGGPLYTLYKVLTAISLSERLSWRWASLKDSPENSTLDVVPVLWNASDDSDFAEVSSATFFERDLSLKRFSIVESRHQPGNMVGSTSTEALNGPIETLMHGLEKSAGTDFLMSCIEDGLSVARDWGEFFSALFLRLLSSSGLVVVDARVPSVAKYSRQIIDAYLREASSIEVRIAECLDELKEHGYGAPVSPRSGETCLFLKDGMARKKVSKEELPIIADLWRKGGIELLPNVLLGPVVRDELMGPAANIVGPSEASYYIVARVLYKALGLVQRPIFPRLSLTIVPDALATLAGGDPGNFKDLVVSFEKVAQSHFEKHVPPEVARELKVSENEIRSAIERMARLAASSGKGTEEIAASAARKIDFELGRIREGVVGGYRKRVLSENPMLRKAGEFLLPMGALQERTLCSLAPLVYGGECLVKALQELARTYVLDCLEGHVRHYVASVAIP
jgi:bacillithiol biosynthesis cysteine-adding enzyme BshC